MVLFSSKFRNRVGATLFACTALAGCATSDDGDIRNAAPKIYEFDTPRALLAVYTSEIDMLTTCKVGPVSDIFTLTLDPRFDRNKQTASIDLIGTGYFTPHIWGTIELEARGAATTHVRIYGDRRPAFTNLGRDVERWANAGTGC